MLVSEEYLTFKEIAERFKVTVQAVSNWVTRGVLAGGVPQKMLGFKVGDQWRVREEDLQDFLRRLNPDAWQQLALAQDKARREARKDRERLQRKMESTGRQNGAAISRVGSETP